MTRSNRWLRDMFARSDKRQLAKQRLENKNQAIGTAGRGGSQHCVGKGQASMVEPLSQQKRKLEMVQKGFPPVGHTGTCILDVKKVCKTLYRSGSGCCAKDVLAREGESGKGKASLSAS